MERDANKGDINSFIEEGMSRLICDESTRSLVRTKLSAGANGMFLWTKLMLHHLEHQVTLGGIQAALEGPLEGLEPVYSPHPLQHGRSASQPSESSGKSPPVGLFRDETIDCVGTRGRLDDRPKTGYSGLVRENRVLNIRSVIVYNCALLLEIHERKETVRFAHASAPQYLQTLGGPGSGQPYSLDRFPLVPTRRLPYIAACCLRYLADPDVDYVKPNRSPSAFAADLNKHLAQHKFLQYAALNIWEHFPRPDDTEAFSRGSELEPSLASSFSREKTVVKRLQLYQALGGMADLRGATSFIPRL